MRPCLKKQAKVFMSLYVLCESSFLPLFLSEKENYTYDCTMENEAYKCVADTEHSEQNKRGEKNKSASQTFVLEAV